jgi:hypothetical protein
LSKSDLGDALQALSSFLHAQSNLVWASDEDTSPDGPGYDRTKAGRRQFLDLMHDREWVIPTAGQPHRVPELLSIDHIAASESTSGSAGPLGDRVDGHCHYREAHKDVKWGV